MICLMTMDELGSFPTITCCPFPGCGRLVKPAHEGHETACRELHHLLVMCGRYCEVNPQYRPFLEPYYSVDDLCLASKCQIQKCLLPPSPSLKCWCTQDHFLDWLREFCQRLHPVQRCKLANCVKHVFVDGKTFRVHDFCCWTHCQQHHMSIGLQQSVMSHSLVTDERAVPQSSETSMNSHFAAFKAYVLKRTNVPPTMTLVENFFKEHPWTILRRPEEESCLLIAKPIFNEKKPSKRELITRDGYHWKQKGPPNPINKEVEKRYYTYEKLQAAKRKTESHENNQQFYILEYFFSGSAFKEYCLVKLHRGSSANRSSVSRAPRNKKANVKEEEAAKEDSEYGTGSSDLLNLHDEDILLVDDMFDLDCLIQHTETETYIPSIV